MSLYGSIRMASNTLQANQIAMQVIGQNIANASTPGYIREEVIFQPAPTQSLGNLNMGSGVEVVAIVQKIDLYLEERLRGAVSDRSGNEAQEEVFLQLEGLIGELSDTDLSTSLSRFVSSIQEVLNQPDSAAYRHQTVLEGVSLTGQVSRLAERVGELRSDVNDRIFGVADRANQLVEEIRQLNLKIAETEGGDISKSDAVGLRDQRGVALENLAELISIRVHEQPSGGVAVYAGSDFLVFEGTSRPLEVMLDSDRGLAVADIQFAETKSSLELTGGKLYGLLAARDDILGNFQDGLDQFASNLAFEFNKIYSGGQGLIGFSELTGEFAVEDSGVPLDEAGLAFTPVNGSFEIEVHNSQSGLTETTQVRVDLNGLGNDTSLDDLVEAIDAVDGISASVTRSGQLTISSDSADSEFAFSGDSSGALAALGLNVFFTGSTARDLGVSSILRDEPSRFAASAGGIGQDTDNAILLADFVDQPIKSKNGATLQTLYSRLISETTQNSAVTQAVTEGARTFEQTLRGQRMANSGVNLDEEAIRLIGFQNSFQASARYIATLADLFEVLVNL